MEPADAAIDTFLEGAPRSETWRDLKQTLIARRDALRAERDALDPADPRRAGLQRKLAELALQIDALAREEAVTRFVEDSVRATVALPDLGPPDDEEF